MAQLLRPDLFLETSASTVLLGASALPTAPHLQLAKKESEALIQSQLMSPMTDDPSYCCNTLLNFVQTGILTPKEILKPLKVPLKKDAIHAQLTVVNILDGLMKHGSPHAPGPAPGRRICMRNTCTTLQTTPPPPQGSIRMAAQRRRRGGNPPGPPPPGRRG